MRLERPRPRDDEERVLPLINVVFLLLVFFMLAGRLSSAGPFAVEPPHSASEAAVETHALVVGVSADGRLALDGTPMEERALERAVAERLEAGAGGVVRLKADAAAEATRVVAVMELLRRAGVEEMDLLTRPDAR